MSRHSRRSKTVLNGSLTKRLVSPEVMTHALKELVAGVDRYTVVARRFPLDMGSGQPRNPYSIFKESEGIVEGGGGLRPEISNCRHVAIYLETSDNGVALVDLTGRHWTRVAKSDALDQKMLDFNEKLLSEARPFWSSVNNLMGIWFLFAVAGIFLFGAHAELSGAKRLPDGTYELPDWMSPVLGAYATAFLLLLFSALIVAGINILAGGLRTWPRSLTLLGFFQGILRIRDIMTLPDNVGKGIIALVAALVSVTLTWMLK